MYSIDSAIPDRIRKEISERIRDIEQEEDVRVFFACESGSRAWGFPSADSDFDVRFLYVRRPEWYLSIDLEHRRDVIERPISDLLDISGWDLRKGLQLLRKSNPALTEWLQSPIVYSEFGSIPERLRSLLPVFHSPRSAMYHYLHMAKKNFRSYLRGDSVRTKKYFYVLRPVLAVRWIEAGLGPVPMEFDRLVERFIEPSRLRDEIGRLLAAKRAGAELDEGPRIDPINSFLTSELERFGDGLDVDGGTLIPTEKLNELFRDALAEYRPG